MFIAGVLLGSTPASFATERADIIVDAAGKGHFRSIQAALNSIPQSNAKNVVILIQNGTYTEKLWMEKSCVTLVGENRDSTRIIFAELRENWQKEHGTDWGSGVVNIDSTVTDVTLANLTMYNNYGWKNGVFNKHQFTIRGAGTRIMLLHCTVKSDGGDAVSLWNRQEGMYYHADCSFEGWVDFVCPRGWCYITDSEFFGHNLSASIWHDGSFDRNQKFVIVNSYFDGVPGFPLGRNHRDGQYFLINCMFSKRLANTPIYFPSESPNAKPWIWGQRHYYYGCRREGGDYAWFKDNVSEAQGSPKPEQITAQWTFDGKWDPESEIPSVLPFAYMGKPNKIRVAASGTTLTWVPGRNAIAHKVFLGTTNPPGLFAETRENTLPIGKLRNNAKYYWRIDDVTDAGIIPGPTWRFTTE